MKDYYKILEIDMSDILQNDIETKIIHIKIKQAYKNKIKCFYNLPFLTKKMIQEIKDLKEAYYILSNHYRRNKYDKKRNSIKSDDIVNTKICDRIFSLSFK